MVFCGEGLIAHCVRSVFGSTLFCLQVMIPAGAPFAVELSIVDTTDQKRRIYLSTAFKAVSFTPLHAQLPLSSLVRGIWINLVFDVRGIVAGGWGATLKCVESIVLRPSFYLRRVYTLRDPPPDTTTDSALQADATQPLPPAIAYPPSVETATQVFDFVVMQHSVTPPAQQQQQAPQQAIQRKLSRGAFSVHSGAGSAPPATRLRAAPSQAAAAAAAAAYRHSPHCNSSNRRS